MVKSKSDNELQLQGSGPDQEAMMSNSKAGLIKRFQLLLEKFQILNFMVVGGIGWVINMLVLWQLTPFFKSNSHFPGTTYSLVPFVISSLVAIFCNYELNRIWTFKGWKEQKFGGGRYFIMALATLLPDIFFMFVLKQFFKLPQVPAAGLAILIVFIIRYTIARSWVWSKH